MTILVGSLFDKECLVWRVNLTILIFFQLIVYFMIMKSLFSFKGLVCLLGPLIILCVCSLGFFFFK